jgi:Skp family chaperone for outer membrane proteins
LRYLALLAAAALTFAATAVPGPAGLVFAQEKKAPPAPKKAQPAAAEKKAPAPEGTSLGDVPLRVGIIDINAIQRDALAAKDIRDQINRYRQSFQAEIQKEEEELRNANQELARQRTLVSPDAFAAERKKFEERLAEVGRLVEQRKQELERSHGESLLAINKALQEVVIEVANEGSLTLVLRRDQTVLAAKAMEITDEVLERLNKKMPSFKVPVPGK